MAKFIDRWLGRLSGAYTFSPLLPAGLVGVVFGFLSQGVEWISQFGLFGWLSAGICAFAITGFGFATVARAQLWRVESKGRTQLSGESSPLDPMEPIFRNKRIKIIDLINPYDQVVLNKKFIDCEIIGPANILIMFNRSKFHNNNFERSDSIEIRDDAIPQNATNIVECDFEGCRFFKVSMLFQSSSRKAADELITSQNWLTFVDEPKLFIEDQSNERSRLSAFFRRTTKKK